MSLYAIDALTVPLQQLHLQEQPDDPALAGLDRYTTALERGVQIAFAEITRLNARLEASESRHRDIATLDGAKIEAQAQEINTLRGLVLDLSTQVTTLRRDVTANQAATADLRGAVGEIKTAQSAAQSQAAATAAAKQAQQSALDACTMLWQLRG